MTRFVSTWQHLVDSSATMQCAVPIPALIHCVGWGPAAISVLCAAEIVFLDAWKMGVVSKRKPACGGAVLQCRTAGVGVVR
jgi:hypothetical protein